MGGRHGGTAMRHFILAAALVAAAGLAHAGSARKLGAVAIAIDLAAVATAANHDLRPTAHAYKQSA
ncbi:MAG: hypothetical protein CBARDCOR_6736 [uncultured Caballeronia sp.]|nr:MAG: hypothetical protein CBARDCOR_6736 [uncultured Caballeronia sp.]